VTDLAQADARAPNRLDLRFRAFQGSVLASDVADGIYRISLPLLALSVSHSAMAVSAVGVAVRAPWLVATLPAGIVIDRYDPLAVLRRASWIRLPLVAALALLAWLRALPVWGLVPGAFLVATAGAVVDIAAQSMPSRLVTAPVIPRANAAVQTGQTLAAQFAGPALGGFLAASVGGGIGIATLLYAGTLAGLEVLARRVSAPASPSVPQRQRSPRSALGELRAGAAYFRSRGDLIMLASVAGAGNLAYAAATTILPLWVVSPGRLNQSAAVLGLILSSPAIGGALGGVTATRALRRFGSRGILALCAPMIGMSFLALAVPDAIAAAVAMTCYGLLSVQLNVMSISYRQTSIPRELFGRVNAVYRWIILGISPLGSLIGGIVAVRLGIAAVFIGAGGIALVSGVMLPTFASARLLGRQPYHEETS
jgi:MFS family permease